MSQSERWIGPCAGCGGYLPCDCADQIPTHPDELRETSVPTVGADATDLTTREQSNT